jgi:hypothetical protein
VPRSSECVSKSRQARPRRERRRKPALLCPEECVAREAESKPVAQAPYYGILAQLAHAARVHRPAARGGMFAAHLQQINRMGVRRNTRNPTLNRAHSSGDEHG